MRLVLEATAMVAHTNAARFVLLADAISTEQSKFKDIGVYGGGPTGENGAPLSVNSHFESVHAGIPSNAPQTLRTTHRSGAVAKRSRNKPSHSRAGELGRA
jgi:hypothetical protein